MKKSNLKSVKTIDRNGVTRINGRRVVNILEDNRNRERILFTVLKERGTFQFHDLKPYFVNDPYFSNRKWEGDLQTTASEGCTAICKEHPDKIIRYRDSHTGGRKQEVWTYSAPNKQVNVNIVTITKANGDIVTMNAETYFKYSK